MATLTASHPALSRPSGASCAGERGTDMKLEWLRRALAVMGCCVMFAAVSACGGGGAVEEGAGACRYCLRPQGLRPSSRPPRRHRPHDVRIHPVGVHRRALSPPFFCGYLPAGCDQGTDAYPVIYALDGDAVNGLPQTRCANLQEHPHRFHKMPYDRPGCGTAPNLCRQWQHNLLSIRPWHWSLPNFADSVGKFRSPWPVRAAVLTPISTHFRLPDAEIGGIILRAIRGK